MQLSEFYLEEFLSKQNHQAKISSQLMGCRVLFLKNTQNHLSSQGMKSPFIHLIGFQNFLSMLLRTISLRLLDRVLSKNQAT